MISSSRIWLRTSITARIKISVILLLLWGVFPGCVVADPVPASRRVLPDVSGFTELPLSGYMRLRDDHGYEIRQFMTPEGIFCRTSTYEVSDISCEGNYPDYLPVGDRLVKDGKCVWYLAYLPNASYYDKHPGSWKYVHYPVPIFPYIGEKTNIYNSIRYTPCGLPPHPGEPVTPLVLLKNHMLTTGYKISFKGIVCAELDNHIFTCQSGKHGFVLAPDDKSWEQ